MKAIDHNCNLFRKACNADEDDESWECGYCGRVYDLSRGKTNKEGER